MGGIGSDVIPTDRRRVIEYISVRAIRSDRRLPVRDLLVQCFSGQLASPS